MLQCLPPVVQLFSNLSCVRKYNNQKVHGWQQNVTKLLILAYLSLEVHKAPEKLPEEEQVEEPGVTEVDPVAEEETNAEDVDMAVLASVVNFDSD